MFVKIINNKRKYKYYDQFKISTSINKSSDDSINFFICDRSCRTYLQYDNKWNK